MDKRATRQATLYSILFLVMLFFAGITFFLGLQVGVDKTEEKYAHLLKDNTKVENYLYQQQDLVSFYLTTYSPYEQYQTNWFENISAISANKLSNPSNVFDELATQAAKRADDASSTSMIGYGLLESAQQSYVRSLNFFEEAAKELKKSTDKKSSTEAINIINSNENYQVAIEQALKAQHDYFNAMYKWTVEMDPTIASTFDSSVSQSLSSWSEYPLIIKLNIVSNHLSNQKIYNHVLPQDIVSRIDEFIISNQATLLNLTTVNEILNLLLATDAIRFGDYDQYKGDRYVNEFLPKIPFLDAN